MLARLKSEIHQIVSKDSVKDKHTQLANITLPDDPQKTGRLLKCLKISIGACVMLTNNIDVTDGLTNGAMGTITHIVKQQQNVDAILVKFDSDRVGKKCIQNSRFKHFCNKSVPIFHYHASFFVNN